MSSTLTDILTAAANGDFPAPDGSTTILPQPGGRDAGVLSFTAHSVIFLDEDPEWIRAELAAASPDPLAASMTPRFLTALSARSGRSVDHIDLMTVADALPGAPELPLREIHDQHHPRVERALKYRDEVRVWVTDGGLVTLGRGVAGRMEVAVEVDETARHRGLGRALATAARHLTPDPHIWSQQTPGNARSVRAFQGAGYRPVGAEALLIAK
ncbi:GNAT family N-acetyltransferase [Streptomyces sp. NPDC090025]|uniref:GNAT family N-acetyltransferase n=1 Tax=Streptomyces sp. NPDC090025 TaxID=3365922 RepID=UPI0038393EBB